MTSKKVLLKENIEWVGYVDDRKVPFHRLILEKGTTYNSYLLKTEKPTIIDTVDIQFGGQYIENLKAHIDLKEIQYIVINHVEPDHAGALPALVSQAPNAIIVTTELGAEELKEMFKLHNKEFLIIRDGDTLDIGGKTLKFFETPFLHTEETMITYSIEDKILFPCDQFSSHIATYELFDDLAEEDFSQDFEVYYKLIMHPHRPYVQDMVKKIKNLDIEIIAPSHGFILRKDAKKYIDLYDRMSQPTEESKKALILFSTMTGNTTKVAKYIGEGLEEKQIEHKIMNVSNTDKQEVLEEILLADAIFFGSSTRYADMVGNMEGILKELKAMDLSDKLGIAFGSYGWSGEAIEVIQDYLKDINIKAVGSSYIIKTTGMDHIEFPIRVKFRPKEIEQEKIIEAAKVIGDLLIA